MSEPGASEQTLLTPRDILRAAGRRRISYEAFAAWHLEMMTNTVQLASRRIGVDIGRVLIGSDSDEPGRAGGASMFGPDFLQAPPVPDALLSLATLVRTTNAVHLISKCGPRLQQHTEQWLDAYAVYGSTGLPRHNLHFVRKRSEKGPVASRLGLDTFVDDRLDVLIAMPPTVHTRILFGVQKLRTLPAWAIPALDWAAALRALEPGDTAAQA